MEIIIMVGLMSPHKFFESLAVAPCEMRLRELV